MNLDIYNNRKKLLEISNTDKSIMKINVLYNPSRMIYNVKVIYGYIEGNIEKKTKHDIQISLILQRLFQLISKGEKIEIIEE